MQHTFPTNAHPQSVNRPSTTRTNLLLIAVGGVILGGSVIVALIVGALFVIGGSAAQPTNLIAANTMVRGTGIMDVAVGGLTVDAAAAKLMALAVTQPITQSITLRDSDRTWPVAAADLGIALNGQATAIKALQTSRAADFAHNPARVLSVLPVYSIDLTKAQSKLIALSGQINVAVGANGGLSAGRALNVTATLNSIPPDLGAMLASGTLALVMDSIKAPQTTYIVEHGQELNLIAKLFNVTPESIIALNNISNADQIYPGQSLLIPAAGIWVPTEKDAPPAPSATDKAIVAVIKEQRLYAYENGHLVHSTLMSSGTIGHDTVAGDYHVFVKYTSTRMTGPGYDLPDVPWTMYFYEGYGIHGAYWHNSFGREMSHGCINLEVSEAKWFYDFAPIGTLVRIIRT